MMKVKYAYKFVARKTKGRQRFRNLNVDGSIVQLILKSKKKNWIQLAQDTSATGSYGNNNE
jgi:hypothetical protein